MAGIYIHIPFCHSKCDYCNFYSTPSNKYENEYIKALATELGLRSRELNGCRIKTVYIGGGTPTALSRRSLEFLFSFLHDSIKFDDIEEFTVEANPEDIDDNLINFLTTNGVNRISVGIQSLDDNCLRAVGRRHDSNLARHALSILAESGINYSADLIFGLPEQSIKSWNESLMELISFNPPHLSSYLLSYEPGTRLYAMLHTGRIAETSEEDIAFMYNQLIETAGASGYRHYEISNYALPGKESRHNYNYWNLTPYIGLGVSAHSFDGHTRRYNPSSLKQYIESLSQGELVTLIDAEDNKARFNDMILTALRTESGISLTDAKLRFPLFYRTLQRQLQSMASDGRLIQSESDNWRIPESQWLMADSVIRDLFII